MMIIITGPGLGCPAVGQEDVEAQIQAEHEARLAAEEAGETPPGARDWLPGDDGGPMDKWQGWMMRIIRKVLFFWDLVG